MEDFEIKPGTEASIQFSDLCKTETLPDETPGEFLARINDPSKWLYGSEVRDNMLLRGKTSLARYGHLARKAFIHYLGSRYNPHTVDYMDEIQLRTLISWIIEYKVQGRVQGYDWELIDNLLIKFIHDLMEIQLPDDYKPIDREMLQEFRSPYHGLELLPPN